MNDEQLESLLRQSAGPDDLSGLIPAGLAGRVRCRRQQNARQRRRHTVAAVLVGGYLAGLATAWGWNALSSATAHPEFLTNNQTESTAEQRTAATSVAEPESTVAGRPLPRSRDIVPFPRDSQYERLRRLGDEYLQERGDVTTALVFYRQALEEGSPDEVAVSEAGDSWLLKSLKRDRLTSSSPDRTGDAI